jgi:hypothetical protein
VAATSRRSEFRAGERLAIDRGRVMLATRTP